MKSFNLKYGRVIDFEGSKKAGIQQAAIIDFCDFKIISSKEYNLIDGNFREWLIDITRGIQIDYWVAHNAHIEKLLITESAPYRISTDNQHKTITWGPWIDTLKIHRTLYPQIEDYTLKNLAERFLNLEKVNEIADRFCNKNSKSFHQAMYDTLITYKLLERLHTKINLRLFLD